MACFEIQGDLNLTDDETDVVLISGLGVIKQNIDIGATVFQGFWSYDVNAGLPYFEALILKGADLNSVRSIWYNFFLSIDGVLSVESITLDVDPITRKGSLGYVLRCDGGTLTGSLPFDVVSR